MTALSGSIVLAQEGNLPIAPTVAPGGNGAPANTSTSTAQPGSPNAQQAPPQSPFGGGFMFIMLGLFGFMIFMLMMAGRKEKKRVAAMLSSMKRHDRVLLAGGMIGTLAEVRDDEVVVKVDDSTNTRIHFRKSAIQQVLRSASGEAASTETSAA